MSSLHRWRSLRSGGPNARKAEMKYTGIRRQLAQHGRSMQKISVGMIQGPQPLRRKLSRVQHFYTTSKRIYHEHGLKHVMLLLLLVMYQFFGAALFLYLEQSAEEDKEKEWRRNVTANRTQMIDKIFPSLFNNSERTYIIYLSPTESDQVIQYLNNSFDEYERSLGIKYSDQKIKWDFWNAMLYAGTVCTTIGYGHLYPNTYQGQWATMIYAIFGIPLVLSILEDMGKVLTKLLKYPWFVVKMICRRISKHCTNLTSEQIRNLDQADRDALHIFDLPIPVALGVVIAWIFFSSATFSLFEDWDYFKSFYFFFISLTTIGLGDIVPQQPKYLLFMFGYIIVGLSLVSMCVNLIQTKLEKSYNAGGESVNDTSPAEAGHEEPKMIQTKTTLGVLQRRSSHASSRTNSPNRMTRLKRNKMCQTILSIPSPSRHPRASASLVNMARRTVPTSISFDDVMKLVDTEEGDIIVLSELVNEDAETSIAKDVHADENSEDDFNIAFDSVLVPEQKGNQTRETHFRHKVSIIPNTQGQADVPDKSTQPQPDQSATAARVQRKFGRADSSSSDDIIKCSSPTQDVGPLDTFLSASGSVDPAASIIACEGGETAQPPQSLSAGRRLSHFLFGSRKPSMSGMTKRFSLFGGMQRKKSSATNKPLNEEEFEHIECRETDAERISIIEETDRTPLDPNSEKRSKFFSHS